MSMRRPLPQANAALFRQLAAAARRKIPLHAVLAIFAEDRQTFGQSRRWVGEMAQQMAAGGSLSGAMDKASEMFTPETVQLVRLAEQAAQLAPACDALADEFQSRGEASRAVRQAMAWPLAVLCVGFSVLGLMVSYVIPQFESLYGSLNAALPMPTRALVPMVRFTLGYWWAWAIAIALVAAFLLRGPNASAVGGAVRTAACWIPAVRRYAVARLTVRLVSWLHAFGDQPALCSAALAHVRATSSTPRIRKAVRSIESSLAQSARLSDALSRDPILPRRLALFARLGETMQDVQSPLAQLEDMAEADAADALNRFERRLILALYVLVAVAVGFLLTALYLPIFKLGSVI